MRLQIIGVGTMFLLLFGAACSSSRQNDLSYKGSVEKALEQADLQDVTVTEDPDKNTITLGGKVHSENAKAKAAQVARGAAGNRIVANEVSVQPVGAESEAKDIASNIDDAIEKNYKAVLISDGLDKQHIAFSARNGVLTIKGSVKDATQRQHAQQLAAKIPNVQQVLNQIDVKR